jgi:hypothetical protein
MLAKKNLPSFLAMNTYSSTHSLQIGRVKVLKKAQWQKLLAQISLDCLVLPKALPV